MAIHSKQVEAGRPLVFGIFPGMTGTEGLDTGSARGKYVPGRTAEAIARLQGSAPTFVVRAYSIYKGGGRIENRTPPDCAPFRRDGWILDHVLCYRPEAADLADWTEFVRQTVREIGDRPSSLQVTEEPNNPDAATGGDGSSPEVIDAIVQGVLAAKDEARRRNLPVDVGFNACPSFAAEDPFWLGLAAAGGPAFAAAVDYVGLDFFPDVFRPLPFAQIDAA